MYRCPKEQTPDAYLFNVLSDGRSVDYNRKENYQRSFSSAPRFIDYKQLAKRTGPAVGPGSYAIQESLKKLKQKPCMALFTQTQIVDEQYYELVNNIRVLQPKYLKSKERKVFEKSIHEYAARNKLLKRINQSFVHQRSILAGINDADRASSNYGKSNIKSRNNLGDDTVDYNLLERPHTQQAFSRNRKFITNQGHNNYQTLNAEQFPSLEEPLLADNNQRTIDVLSLQNHNAKRGLKNKGQSSHNHTYSLMERTTLMNGSTANASSFISGVQNNLDSTSGLTSLKAKSKQSSEFGLRIRNQQSAQGQAKRGVSKKSVDKNKKYIKQIINNNCFFNGDKETRTANVMKEHFTNEFYLQQPSFDGIEVNLNDNQLGNTRPK
eukprot:403375544